MKELWKEILSDGIYHVSGYGGIVYLPVSIENYDLLKKHNLLECAISFKELESNKMWYLVEGV